MKIQYNYNETTRNYEFPDGMILSKLEFEEIPLLPYENTHEKFIRVAIQHQSK